MPDSAAQEIRSALADPNPRQSAETVVELAARLISSTDRSMRVYKTGHFNNTFVPDLVLSWPQDSRKKRDVFLRTTTDAEWLTDDIGLVPPTDSMLIALEHLVDQDTSSQGTTGSTSIATESSQRQVLVAGSDSLESLAEAGDSAASVALFSSALLRGGRGYVQEQNASILITSVREGFQGAQAANYASTARLLQRTDEFLDRSEDQRFTEVLQALWVGGGALASEFPPSDTEARADLDGPSLRFLLTNEELTDASFWPRLARSIDLQTVLDLGELPVKSALDDLMRAAATQFRAKVCCIRDSYSEAPKSSTWRLSDGRLSLSIPYYQFFIAQRAKDLLDLPGEVRVPETSEILDRISSNDYELTEIQVSDGTRSVRMSDSDLADVDTASLDGLFSGEAAIDNLSVTSPKKRRLTVFPSSGRVSARTNSKLYVDDLIGTAAVILGQLSVEQLAVDQISENKSSESI